MAGLSGTLAADFAQFNSAVEGTLVKLRSFETGGEKVGAALTKMANSFSGQKIIQDATLMEKAVRDVGGASTLTEKEMARVNATVTEAIAKYKALGGTAPKSMTDLAHATSQTNTATSSFTAGLSKVNGLLGGLGVALSVGAVVSFGKSLIDDASALVKLADKTGVSIEWLEKFQVAGDDAGNTTEELAAAVNMMQKRFDDNDFKSALSQLGISFQTIRNLSPEEQFVMLADAVRKVHDPVKQAQLATDLFGKTGVNVLPTLKRGFDDVKNAAVGMGSATARSLDAVGDEWDRLSRQLKGEAAQAFVFLAKNVAKGQDTMKTFEDHSRDVTKQLGIMAQGATSTGPKMAMLAPLDLSPRLEDIEKALGTTTVQLEKQERAADKTRAAAEKFKQETERLTDAARKNESAVAGLHSTLGHLDTREQDIIKATRDAYDAFKKLEEKIYDVEKSSWIAAFGFQGMTDGLDKIGKKSTELDDVKKHLEGLTVSVGEGQQATGDWGDSLGTLSNDFAQMAQIGGDSFGGLSKTMGTALSTVKLFKDGTDALGKALDHVSAVGGKTATNYVAVAASMATVATAMWTVVAATLAYWDAENKRQNAAQQAKTLQNGFNAAFGTSFGLTVNMTRAIEDLTARYKDYVNVRLGLSFKEEEAEALLMVDIIRDLGGAAALTAKHLDFIKTDSIGRLLDMINQGGPLAVKAMQSLQALFDELVPGLDDITEAAARYGLTLDDLGPKVKQMSIDKTAAQIAKDFEMLIAAGVPFETLMRDIITRTTESGANFDKMSKDAQDAYLKAGGVVTTTTTGMQEQVQKLVSDALRLGLTLPESMKPIIESLIASGDLVDENGDKLTDLSQINFTKPLEKMVDDLMAKLDQLISKFLDVGNTVVPPVKVPIVYIPGNRPDDVDIDIPFVPVSGASTGAYVTDRGLQHFAGGGTVLNFRPRGSDTVPAMLTPGEMVLTPGQQQRLLHGGGDTTALQNEIKGLRADVNRLFRDQPRTQAIATASAILRKRRAA